MSISTQPNLTALKAEIIADINANTDSNAADTLAAIAAKGFIKSIQRGSALLDATTVNVTISAVNPDKTVVFVRSHGIGSSTGAARLLASGQITSATNMQLLIGDAVSVCTAVWQVIEYE